MRRASADPGSGGKLNKNLQHRRITLPNSGTFLSLLGNGQAVSEVNVVDGNPSPRLESRKSDADATSLSAGSSTSFGTANPPTLTSNGTDNDLQKTRTAIANLHRKIHQTMELIRVEQNAQAENVNEYLESVKSDRPNSQHAKSAFEKKNQKSTQTIMGLQGKLETYQKKLAEVQLHGTGGPRDVLKNVSQGLKTMVSKPVEFATMLKNRLGSMDNVSTGINDDRKGTLDESERMLPLNVMSLPGARHSMDNNMSGVALETTDNKRTQDAGHQARSNSQHSPLKGHPLPADRPIPRTLQEVHAETNELRNGIAALKMQMHVEFADLKQTLEVERDLCDRLEEQLNDLTELHQNEMADIKQEISSLEEKMQYMLDDRTRDLHELLESCLQRVTKVEQQQHQQLIQTEGLEGSTFSIAKIINFVLAFLSFCLILLSTLASLVSPFLSTRLRYFLTFCLIVCCVLAWRNWDFVSHVAGAFADAYLLPWLPEIFSSSNLTDAA